MAKIFIIKFCTFSDGIAVHTFHPLVALLYFDQQLARDKYEKMHRHENQMMEELYDMKDFARNHAHTLFPDDELFDKAFEKLVRVCAKNRFHKKEITAVLACEDTIVEIVTK